MKGAGYDMSFLGEKPAPAGPVFTWVGGIGVLSILTTDLSLRPVLSALRLD